jgi:dephospho-CoA kinase
VSDDRPHIIGITGNIACGKSTVSGILAELGAEVIDADRVAHEVMAPGSPVVEEVVRRFGREILADDGSIDRPALGRIVFSDPDALRDLERITHPPTVAEILCRARSTTAMVAVIDAVKLFEAGLARHCDENWTVYCDPKVQRERLMRRNGFDEQEANRRISAQPPQDEKVSVADRIINNSGNLSSTRQQTVAAWRAFQRTYSDTGK